jgi:hypothetical protein
VGKDQPSQGGGKVSATARMGATKTLLAWIPIQKKKPNNSPEFLRYFRYNRLFIVVLVVYQYTMFHAVCWFIQIH